MIASILIAVTKPAAKKAAVIREQRIRMHKALLLQL
jgi:hypothetical protein